MNFKFLILPLVLFVSFSGSGYAQSKVMKEADGLYYTKRYREAYNLYQGIKLKKKDISLTLKMAECNFNIENYTLAQDYYSQYFADTLYHAVPEYTNFAISARKSGNVPLTASLYGRILRNGDESVRSIYEPFRYYVDSSKTIRVYDLDSSYNCIDLDATLSVDLDAAAMFYVWDFKDGSTAEGVKVTHCFKKEGANTISLNIRDKATGYVRMNDTSLTVYVSSPPVKFSIANNTRRIKQYIYTKFEAPDVYVYDHDVLEYIWELGEGDYATGKKIQKKFNKIDFYNVRLTVVAKNKTTGQLAMFSSGRLIEVVDNYSDHSQKFQDNLNGVEK
ncbi:MAG: PKD domain-containing protein [Bacteroidia bacterium]|nr:PKD domain-containing protein [Bacteroidia bacterium]